MENFDESQKPFKCELTTELVAPPSFEDLEKRLRGRGTETEDKIEIRLKNARGELAYLDKKDFWDAIIVNDDLDKAYKSLKEILVEPPKS